MPKLVTWMNNQRVGELTKLANGAHTFKYAPEWLANNLSATFSGDSKGAEISGSADA
ncbi:TPA: HipA N-terminal domain-containing protein [Escherichia coli]|nr:HipA N-terminal domain-containing protein [Escherichia coli]HDK0972676.1 HipA N-terminal domain-containing protein [Escherichia coli]HDK1009609.1 HipA N-terminal domain-containing protein [Escherichia coli]